jgi:VWFA-related protein
MRKILLIVLLLSGSTWLAAQTTAPSVQRPPTFRSGVALVQMDVTVLDDHRHPVTGLSADDFTVFEDGVARPIAAFTAVDLPSGSGEASAGDRVAVPTSEPSTARRAAPAIAPAAMPTVSPPPAAAFVDHAPGRLVAILMDRSTPPGEPTIVAKQIADAVVDALGPGDEAAVLYTGFGAPQEFTRDRTLLHATIARSDPSAVDSEESQQVPMAVSDPLSTGACYCGLCVPETIAHVAEAVQDAPQRKVLFFVGHDMTFQSSRDDCGFLLRKARDRMVRAIDVANLTIHVIDPSGLETITCAAKAFCSGGPDSVEIPGRGRVSAAMARSLADAGRLASNSDRAATLMTLPGYTGGRTVLNTNAPWTAVPAIFAESSAYYLLAIQPAHTTADGSYHRLEVKVKRRGVHVRAREGYYAKE